MRLRAPPVALSALVALGCLFRPAAAYVISRLDPEVTAKVRLFEHVLRNDAAWRLVLDQRIVISDANRPPYSASHGGGGGGDGDDGGAAGCSDPDHVHDPEARAAVRLLDAGPAEVTAQDVLQRVLDHHAWLGSHVHYAAYVLRTAFACVTYAFVSLQLDLLAMRVAAAAPEPARRSMFEDEWAALAVFADKLAAVRGDLRPVGVMSLLFAEFRDPLSPYRAHRAYLLDVVRRQLDASTGGQCARAEPNDVLRSLGLTGPRADRAHLAEDAAAKRTKCIVDAYEGVSDAAAAMYDGMNVHTADLVNWKQVLDYQTAVSMNVNFFLTGVEEALKKDRVGRRILREKWLSEAGMVDDGDADEAEAARDTAVPITTTTAVNIPIG